MKENGGKEGRKAGRKEGGKEGRTEGGKEGRKERGEEVERGRDRQADRENLGGAALTDNDPNIAGPQDFTFVHGRHAFSIHKDPILSALDDF
jgi:hypothetical protein